MFMESFIISKMFCLAHLYRSSGGSVVIRPFEKRSYYVIPLGARPSVCKLFRFRVTPPTVYVRLS